jgi:hypothetical protein
MVILSRRMTGMGTVACMRETRNVCITLGGKNQENYTSAEPRSPTLKAAETYENI